MALNGKMQAYAEARANGMEPLVAAAEAGYSGAGIRVTTTRLEKRVDMIAEIARLKGGGKGSAPAPDDDLEGWGYKDRYATPLDLLLDVMNNPQAPKSLRYQAAKDALPYCHARKEAGKKDEQKEKAKGAAQGRFQPGGKPSHLRSVK